MGKPLKLDVCGDPGDQKLFALLSLVIFAKCLLLQILNPSEG